MEIISDHHKVQNTVLAWKKQGLKIGFVPTMGFLHSGHTSLMKIARGQCDRLVVSIFVNPLQFAPHEDLATYPRDEEGDLGKCREEGVDLVLMPETVSAFYPPNFSTSVSISGLTAHLCGADRPHFFGGVATVVARLFGVVQPDCAVFGEKDYQQLAVIKRMVRDLAMPIEIIGGPLIRDYDGIALSSRNAYLSKQDRPRARTLSQALEAMVKARKAGEVSVEKLKLIGNEMLDVDRLDYLEIVDADSLEFLNTITGPARIVIAAVVGKPRLLDNMAL